MSSLHWLTLLVFVFPIAGSLQAGDPPRRIIPDGWRPDVSAAIDWLEQDLQETKAQQGMNSLSRRIADLKDAELFALYVELYERLDGGERAKLQDEQARWLKARAKYAEDAIDSRGGSAAPLEANEAEIKFTEQRMAGLWKKLSASEHMKEPNDEKK